MIEGSPAGPIVSTPTVPITTFPIFTVRSMVPEYLPEKSTADNPGSGPRQLVQSRDPVIAA